MTSNEFCKAGTLSSLPLSHFLIMFQSRIDDSVDREKVLERAECSIENDLSAAVLCRLKFAMKASRSENLRLIIQDIHRRLEALWVLDSPARASWALRMDAILNAIKRDYGCRMGASDHVLQIAGDYAALPKGVCMCNASGTLIEPIVIQ